MIRVSAIDINYFPHFLNLYFLYVEEKIKNPTIQSHEKLILTQFTVFIHGFLKL